MKLEPRLKKFGFMALVLCFPCALGAEFSGLYRISGAYGAGDQDTASTRLNFTTGFLVIGHKNLTLGIGIDRQTFRSPLIDEDAQILGFDIHVSWDDFFRGWRTLSLGTIVTPVIQGYSRAGGYARFQSDNRMGEWGFVAWRAGYEYWSHWNRLDASGTKLLESNKLTQSRHDLGLSYNSRSRLDEMISFEVGGMYANSIYENSTSYQPLFSIIPNVHDHAYPTQELTAFAGIHLRPFAVRDDENSVFPLVTPRVYLRQRSHPLFNITNIMGADLTVDFGPIEVNLGAQNSSSPGAANSANFIWAKLALGGRSFSELLGPQFLRFTAWDFAP